MCYKLNSRESITKTFTESEVELFAKLTGDCNAIHLDYEKAKKSLFGERVVHGMLVASLLSAVIGTKLPGEGTIYMEQEIKFLLPVKIGDTVTAQVEIVEILNVEKRILKLNTEVRNQRGELVIRGYAVVKAPDKGRKI